MTIFSAAILLFLVLDPIGNIPAFASILSGIEPHRAHRVLVRELLIALAVLIAFLFGGRFVLDVLRISEPALGISGGVIIFLVALKMIFSDIRELFANDLHGEPFVVPLAIPLIAGPAAMTILMILMADAPSRWLEWLVALILAWLASVVILLLAGRISRGLGERGIVAGQRLMGMILTTVAIQMFLDGIQEFFHLA